MLTERTVPLRYVFDKVKEDVFRVLLISIAFHTAKVFFADYLPPIPLALPALLGTAISLLLGFNINQSYDRWWEARKVWGAIVNDSRTLVLQLKGFVQGEDEGAAITVKAMAHRQIAWCHCLGRSLRGQVPITSEEERYLSAEELPFLQSQTNKSYGLLMLQTADLRDLLARAALNPFQQVQIDGTFVRLCDSMGKAERINNTVFPTTYRLFIHSFIYLFLIVLSLSLVETIGVWEIPILVAIASAFFLIEKTARHMQDPFRNKPTDTAVTAIARTIEINILQVLGEPDVPQPHPPGTFFLM